MQEWKFVVLEKSTEREATYSGSLCARYGLGWLTFSCLDSPTAHPQ